MKINWNSFYRDLVYSLNRFIKENYTLKCGYSPKACKYTFVLTIDDFSITADVPDEIIATKDYFTLLRDTLNVFYQEYLSVFGG